MSGEEVEEVKHEAETAEVANEAIDEKPESKLKKSRGCNEQT